MNNSTSVSQKTEEKPNVPKIDGDKSLDLGNHLLNDITKSSSDVVKGLVKANPLIEKTLYDADDKPKDKYFTKHNA